MAQLSIYKTVERIDFDISRNIDYFFAKMMERAEQCFVVFNNEQDAFVGIMTQIEKRDAEMLHYSDQARRYMAVNFYEHDMLFYALSENHFDARMHFSFLKSDPTSIKLEMIYSKKHVTGKGVAAGMLAVLDQIATTKNIKQITGTLMPFDYCENMPERLTKFYARNHYNIVRKNKEQPVAQSGDKLRHALNKEVVHQIKHKTMLVPTSTRNFTVIVPDRFVMHSGYKENGFAK